MRRNGMKRIISFVLTAGLCLSQAMSTMAAGNPASGTVPAVRSETDYPKYMVITPKMSLSVNGSCDLKQGENIYPHYE